MNLPNEIPIQIDRKPYKSAQQTLSAAQLRGLAVPPIGSERDLFQRVPGQGDDIKLADDAKVQLEPGMHFYSAPKTINPGDASRLPEGDELYLQEKGLHWELLSAGAQGACLVLKNVQVALDRYDRAEVELMLRLLPGYPMTALDMFYIFPELRLKSGSYPQAADVFEDHCGRRWQRFSRHLGSPWRPGVDSLEGFLALALGEIQGKR